MQKHKALFLDRDGVINADTGYSFKPEQVSFLPGLFDFCRNARAQGYLIIVVTNQAGIGRGLYTQRQFHDFMHWMEEHFEAQSCPWTAYYFCPHHPDIQNPYFRKDCDCRKPRPGMILRAIEEYDIDPMQSLLVGDRETDLQAGRAAGVGRLELFTGVFPAL